MQKSDVTMSKASRTAPRCARVLLTTVAMVLFCMALTPAYGEARNPNGVAVIIGNKAYERVPEVSYAHRDAAAFKRYVIDVLGYDEENVIELLDATQADLWTAFGSERSHEGSTLWSYLHPRGSDVVVFYSGHGVPGLNDRRGYLLPRDADPNTAEINGYPIDVLYDNLRKLEEARTVTVYLDACFSGDSPKGMLVGSASPVSWSAELPEEAVGKLTVLTAASGQQLASWDEETGHGLFTNHLLDALYGKADEDGDGRITAGEVGEYLLGTMTIAARRTYKRLQVATLNGVRDAVLSSAVQGAFPERTELRTEQDGSVFIPSPQAKDSRRTVEQDKYLLGMQRAHEAKDHDAVLEFWEKLTALGGEVPLVGEYYRGVAHAGSGRGEEASEALQRYLERAGKEGEHYEAALTLLLDVEEAMASDDAAFAAARRTDTAGAYATYLQEYPDGRYVDEARQRRAAIEADDTAYRHAKSTGTAAAYREYVASYPSGRHVDEARRRQREAEQEERLDPGERFQDCADCPELIVVPAGLYMMGSPASERGRSGDEGPVHQVTIKQPFAVGVHEVTRGEYGRFVARTGHASENKCRTYESGLWRNRSRSWRTPGYEQTDRHPVVCVSWGDAQAYVRWLTRETGEEYRLLSESEWEYVARAKANTAWYWGKDEAGQCVNANGASCKDGYSWTAPVGVFAQNDFGLYDAAGNVAEWTNDCWNESHAGASSDGNAREKGDCSRRVVRGGSWHDGAQNLRSANRSAYEVGMSLSFLGFRVARSVAFP